MSKIFDREQIANEFAAMRHHKVDRINFTRIGSDDDANATFDIFVSTFAGEVPYRTRTWYVWKRDCHTLELDCVGMFETYEDAIAKFDAVVAEAEAQEEAQEEERIAMREIKDEAETRRQEYIDYVLSKNPLYEFED